MTHTITGEGFTHPEENTVETVATVDSVRYHYMDNLRALAMLAGVFFHAALAYSPLMQNLWLSADPQNSVLLDSISWFMHLFRMPLFFLISGFFALMLIKKRGISRYLKNRSLRILVPFLIFLPLVLASFVIMIGWSISNIENLSPMLQFIAATHGNPDVPQPPFSTTHLWFLFNLGLFCVMITIFKKLKFFDSEIAKVLVNKNFLVFFMPLLLVPSLYSQPTPFPAPERIYPELWSFGFYGVIFIFGGLIYNNQTVLESLKKYSYWLLLTSLAAYAVVFHFMPTQITFADIMDQAQGTPHSWGHLLVAVLESYIAVHMTLVCLVFGKNLLDNHNKFFRFVSDSSYWIYIIHLPVLFYLQFLLLDTNWNLWVKFLAGSFGTIAIGVVSYLVLIRWTPIGWMLNGRRKKK